MTCCVLLFLCFDFFLHFGLIKGRTGIAALKKKERNNERFNEIAVNLERLSLNRCVRNKKSGSLVGNDYHY